jgi:hypothetical protein
MRDPPVANLSLHTHIQNPKRKMAVIPRPNYSTNNTRFLPLSR